MLRTNSSLLLLLLFLIILFVTIPGCNEIYNYSDTPKSDEVLKDKELNQNDQKSKDSDSTNGNEEKNNDELNTVEPTELTISAVGDIMVHGPQLNAQYDHESGEYDFYDNFQYIAPYLEQSDLAMGNLETVLAGEEQEYTGYPLFKTPDALADALKDAGFQVLTTANNHSLDRSKQGIKRTIEVLEDRDIAPLGTRKTTDETSYLIEEIDGIKVGLTAFTYETPRYREQRTINGIPLTEETEQLLDSFNPEELDQDMEMLVKRAETLQEEGAELVVFFMHWGHEYHRHPHEYQKQIAERLVESGVDIIFGSHPHVIQPVDKIKTETGKEGVVIHSMGNFLSNQRSEILENPYTEDGIIFHVDISRNSKGKIALEEVRYTPTWVHRFSHKGERNYNILPLPMALESREEYNLRKEYHINKAERALENTRSILEEGSLIPELETNILIDE